MMKTGLTLVSLAALCVLAACGPSDQADKSANDAASRPAQVVAVATASAAPSSSPAAAATPSAKPASAAPTAAPSALPAKAPAQNTAAPTSTPTVAPGAGTPTVNVPAPAPGATASAAVPSLAADAAPQIVNVAISKTTVHGGDTVSGEVVTSSNVASVEVRIAGFSMSMPKTSPGHFALSYQVPNVPFFFHKTYDMNVIARNARGEATSTSLPITVR